MNIQCIHVYTYYCRHAIPDYPAVAKVLRKQYTERCTYSFVFFFLSFSLFRIIIIIIPTKPITIIFIAKRTTYTKIVVVVNLRSLRRLCSAEREKRGITIIYFNARCTCNIVFRGGNKKKRLNTISTFYIVRLNIKL